MSEIKINTLSEYIEQICALNKSLIKYGPVKNEVMLFRGQADTSFELMPAIGRGRKTSMDVTLFLEERNLIEMAKYRLPDVFGKDLQPLELLALLQHHGIPTRLLDITENALVALYFACCSHEDKDGEVFIFVTDETDITNYPITNAIADSYRFAGSSFRPLRKFLDAAQKQPYFLEFTSGQSILPEEKGTWVKECCDKLFYVYAPIRSLRQRVQRGRYILFPNKIRFLEISGEYVFESMIDPINKDHPDIRGRIKIPSTIKNKLISELELFGISKDALFCDNIDTICEKITNISMKRIGDISNWSGEDV